MARNNRSNLQMPMRYPVTLRQTEEGYSTSCPELPGCWSQGDTEQEALANIHAATLGNDR